MNLRKNYHEIAAIFKRLLTQTEIELNIKLPYGERLPYGTANIIQAAVDDFCVLFRQDNSRFDREQFIREVYGDNITDITEINAATVAAHIQESHSKKNPHKLIN